MFKQDDVKGAAVHDGVLQTRALLQCPELLFIRFARGGYESLQPTSSLAGTSVLAVKCIASKQD